jgi:hypothetical protein
VTKYGNGRRITGNLFEGHNLSESSRIALTEAGEFGLARSTWGTYETAQRMLAKCAKNRNRKFEFPLASDDLLEFIGWLIGDRKVKAGTVNSYLSGLRQLHILKGMEPPIIRTNLVKFLLQGKKNLDNIAARSDNKTKRLPITMNVMRLLKEEVRIWDVSLDQKLLAWAIATVAFHVAFRIHELLYRVEAEFDPDFTLLNQDIRVKTDELGVRSLEVKLKCPKENKNGKAIMVDIFESGGTLCPVKAYCRWRERNAGERNLPVFTDKQGVPVTGSKMNTWLKQMLWKHMSYGNGKFTGHSFRIGLATTLGTLGFSTNDIKEAGRWSSNAYEVYMRLPRKRRLAVAQKISQLEKC